jgi:crotonobetainyl-CoA:carnitine CoA-transferase CaiB-like acyl-CoA transferase
VREYNPRVVYAEVTGCGKVGPWRDKPGQDLLPQLLPGLPVAERRCGPAAVAFSLAIADLFETGGTHHRRKNRVPVLV